MKTSYEDFISRQWLSFEVSLGTLFASQEDLLRALLVEAKLTVSKLNDLIYSSNSQNTAVSGALSDIGVYVKNTYLELFSLNSFLKANYEGTFIYHLNRIYSSTQATYNTLFSMNSFLKANYEGTFLYSLNQIYKSTQSTYNELFSMNSFLKNTNSGSILYYLKDIATKTQNVYLELFSMNSFLKANYEGTFIYHLNRIYTSTQAAYLEVLDFKRQSIAKMDEIIKVVKSIDFGDIFQNITNEAGTNIFDVLESLVSGIFDLGGEIVKATSEIIATISNLIVELSKMLIELIVPTDLDFVDKAFEGLGGDFKLKFDFIFKGIDSFTAVFKTEQKGFEDIELDIGFVGSGTTRIPLSVLNSMAVVVKPLVTAFLLLTFIIDQYKWFHTKGEITE